MIQNKWKRIEQNEDDIDNNKVSINNLQSAQLLAKTLAVHPVD